MSSSPRGVRRLCTLVALVVLGIGALSATAAAQESASDPAEESDAQGVAPSSAQDAEAQALFHAGRVAFTDGRFDDALGYFRRSYELSQRPALLYNIGNAADRLQREPEALEAFERYLELQPEAPNAREVEGRIRVLRAHIEADAASATAAPSELDAASAPIQEPIDEAPTQSGGGVESEWWFWTLIGAAVVGVGVLVGALIVVNQEPSYGPYTLGDQGTIAFTLTVPTP